MNLHGLRVYLAGPMHGYPRWNHDAFAAGAELLRAAGATVASPHEFDLEDGFDPDGDGEDFDLRRALKRDIDAIIDADLVVLLPGWEDSGGVAVELTVAGALGVPSVPLAHAVPAA